MIIPSTSTLRIAALAGALLFSIGAAWAPRPAKGGSSIRLERIASFKPGAESAGGAEISAYDARSARLFVTSAGDASLGVVDLSDPAAPSTLTRLSFGTTVTSVAVHAGWVAVAVPAEPKTDAGRVLFFRADFDAAATPVFQEVMVGSIPDMLAFSPDGKYLLVANEGEPNDAYTVDPEGSVSIIDVSTCGKRGRKPSVRTVRFDAFNAAGPRAGELPAAVRIFGKNATVAQDLEPEYIAFSKDGRTAFAALQENNAVAEIDIRQARVTRITALGFKDFNLAGNGIDASDKDGGIRIGAWPVLGMYLPDAMASFHSRGRTFLITANEGDSRDYPGFSEEVRVKNLALDPAAFPDAAALKKDPALGRLKVTSTLGDADGDGKYEALYAFGARSFSIWNDDMEQVFDSGDELEQLLAARLPALFNSDNEANGTFDSRSASKGPEPEGVATGELKGRTYAFLGMERIGGIMVYDVTDPYAPAFVQYENSRDFEGDVEAGTAGDVGPEGIIFIPKSESPIRDALLVVCNEVSGTLTIFRIKD